MSDEPASQTSQPTITPFDAIRQVTENGIEFWSARDLAKILDYVAWQKFKAVIGRAKAACANSGYPVEDHFNHTVKMVRVGSGAKRKIEDIDLSRYACYLLVQNADPNKEIVAQGQTYFAQRTRQAELSEAEKLMALPEDQKRLAFRDEMSRQDSRLVEIVQQAGVVGPHDLEEFQEHGYKGLYGGLNRTTIKERKGLPAEQDLLDYAGSDELVANLFRVTQTQNKLRREDIKGKEAANQVHHEVGKGIRNVIEEFGNTLPEALPAAKQSIQELAGRNPKKALSQSDLGLKPSLEEEEDKDDDGNDEDDKS